MTGFLVSTKERVFEFDPKHKHGVEEFEGERYSITCYTPRGAEHMSWQEKDVLRTFGFPVTSPNKQATRDCHVSEFVAEKNPRPKKSIRKCASDTWVLQQPQTTSANTCLMAPSKNVRVSLK